MLITKLTKTVDHTATGAAMRTARIMAGRSLRDTAKKMQISASFLSELERGRRNWTVAHALAFKKAIR